MNRIFKLATVVSLSASLSLAADGDVDSTETNIVETGDQDGQLPPIDDTSVALDETAVDDEGTEELNTIITTPEDGESETSTLPDTTDPTEEVEPINDLVGEEGGEGGEGGETTEPVVVEPEEPVVP